MQQEKETTLATSIARQLVSTYTKHIDERIQDLDRTYINLGVDATFKEYEALFNVVIVKVLGLPLATNQVQPFTKNQLYPQRVITECVNPLLDSIQSNNWEKYLDDMENAICVYQVCVLVLEKVRVDKFAHEMESNSRLKEMEELKPTLLN